MKMGKIVILTNKVANFRNELQLCSNIGFKFNFPDGTDDDDDDDDET